MIYNLPDQNLVFIKEKIDEIKTALFKTELGAEMLLPNNIIQTLKVEDDGTVWFFTSFNGLYSQLIDETFYAYLNYNRKGSDCRLQLSGKAAIINQEDAGLFSICNYTKGTYGRLVLVKMKIMQAAYFENKTETGHSWTKKIKQTITHMFQPTQNRTYHFSE